VIRHSIVQRECPSCHPTNNITAQIPPSGASILLLLPDSWRGAAPSLRQLRQVPLTTKHKDIITVNIRLTALCSGLPRWAGTRKVKPIWILLEQETVGGSGISWTLLQTDNYASTTPLSFCRPDALPAAQPTASKHWRHITSVKSNKINSIKSTMAYRSISLLFNLLTLSHLMINLTSATKNTDIRCMAACSSTSNHKASLCSASYVRWQCGTPDICCCKACCSTAAPCCRPSAEHSNSRFESIRFVMQIDSNRFVL